eukprot:15479713-Alexandrium_andersonii.AAC.1
MACCGSLRLGLRWWPQRSAWAMTSATDASPLGCRSWFCPGGVALLRAARAPASVHACTPLQRRSRRLDPPLL